MPFNGFDIFHRRKFSSVTQLFLYFLCFLRYDTFVWKRVDRAVRVLPHSLKRLLRKYNGEFGVIGIGIGFEATKLDTGNGGSSICFNWGWFEAPLIWVGDWGWIAIDRGMAWGCRWRGLLILGPAAVGRCWVPAVAFDVWPWLRDRLASTLIWRNFF